MKKIKNKKIISILVGSIFSLFTAFGANAMYDNNMYDNNMNNMNNINGMYNNMYNNMNNNMNNNGLNNFNGMYDNNMNNNGFNNNNMGNNSNMNNANNNMLNMNNMMYDMLNMNNNGFNNNNMGNNSNMNNVNNNMLNMNNMYNMNNNIMSNMNNMNNINGIYNNDMNNNFFYGMNNMNNFNLGQGMKMGYTQRSLRQAEALNEILKTNRGSLMYYFDNSIINARIEDLNRQLNNGVVDFNEENSGENWLTKVVDFLYIVALRDHINKLDEFFAKPCVYILKGIMESWKKEIPKNSYFGRIAANLDARVCNYNAVQTILSGILAEYHFIENDVYEIDIDIDKELAKHVRRNSFGNEDVGYKLPMIKIYKVIKGLISRLKALKKPSMFNEENVERNAEYAEYWTGKRKAVAIYQYDELRQNPELLEILKKYPEIDLAAARDVLNFSQG